ncbi:TonB-dependent receptor [soil metagenome]
MVEGTVRAQGGSPLEGVRVRFEGRTGTTGTTGTTVETRTDARGRFSLDVTAETPGRLLFDREGYVAQSVSVEAMASDARRDMAVTLQALFVLDAVSVVRGRDRPLLNTDDASQGGAVEAAELGALPAEARDPLKLAFNVPGVSQATAFFGDAPPLTINGDNALYTQYTVDGLDNNEGFLGGPRVQLPIAALRRLEVHTASYRPGLGRSPNGVVDFETRSGTESWQGELFLTGRPGTPLDASPRFTPAGVDPDGFRRFQFGGGIGGPVATDRTFLFTALELSDEREDRIGSTAQTDFLGTELRRSARVFARVDHGWSATQTTTLRVAGSGIERVGQGGGVIVPEADITTIRRGTLASLTHRTSLGQGSAANEFSVQFGTFRWDFPPSESDLTTPQVTIVGPDLTTVEAVVGSSNFIFDESERQVQLKNVFESRIGERQTFRAGADIVHSRFRLLGANTNPMGAYTVVNDGNINPSASGSGGGGFVSIRDIPADVRVLRYVIDASPQQVNLGQTLVGAFVENRWRPRADLTVLAGVRWDYDDLTSRGESSPDLDNFQPRISVNWLPTSRSTLRAGFGVHTGKFPYAVYSDAVQFGTDGNAVVTFEGDAFPPPAFGEGPGAADIAALETDLPPREVRRLFARGLEQPFSRQTSLGWGRELAEHWAISVDGLWIESRNLPRSWDLNPLERPVSAADTLNLSPQDGDPFRPVDPGQAGFRRLTTTDSGGRGQHLALHTTVRRAMVGGFAVEGSWALSRTRNDTEDINFHASRGNDFDAEWADAVNDRRHHVTVRTLWSPSRLQLGAVADYQSGAPMNRVAFFRDLDGSGGIFGNGFLGNHDRFPGVPRNAERLPGAFRLDGSATYGVPLGTGTLDVRAEVFNVLNSSLKTGFANGIPGGGPRTQVGRPGDPVVFNTAAPPRQFQLSARWHF